MRGSNDVPILRDQVEEEVHTSWENAWTGLLGEETEQSGVSPTAHHGSEPSQGQQSCLHEHFSLFTLLSVHH